MNPAFQTIFDAPDSNCLQACIASIFNLPLEEVPNFAEIEDFHTSYAVDGAVWWKQLRKFCMKWGVYPLATIGTREEARQILRGYHLIVVKRDSKYHGLVGYNGEILFDPAGPNDFRDDEIVEYWVFVSLMDTKPPGLVRNLSDFTKHEQ